MHKTPPFCCNPYCSFFADTVILNSTIYNWVDMSNK